jgi:hypothetical protein
MKLLYNYQKILKNGFYLDYFFKNFVFYTYINFIGTNFFYLVDKFLAENFFYNVKKFFSMSTFFVDIFKKMTTIQLIKMIVLVVIQLGILIIL